MEYSAYDEHETTKNSESLTGFETKNEEPIFCKVRFSSGTLPQIFLAPRSRQTECYIFHAFI